MKNEISYPQLRSELIKCVRGKYSQERISAKMGFKSNPISGWENQLSSVDWPTFIELCRACGRDIDRALQYTLGYRHDPLNNADFLFHILGTRKITEIAKKTQTSRFTVANWVKQKSNLDLDLVLKILNDFQFILVEFLEIMIDIQKMPSLQLIVERLERQKNAIYENPEIEAVVCCLALDAYQNLKTHQRGFIAKHTGIAVAQEDKVLRLLEQVGLAEKLNGKYRLQVTQLDTQGSFQGARQIRLYWAQAITNFLKKVQPPEGTRSKTGYFVIDLSEQGEEEVLKAYLEFCFRLRSIAQQDHGPKKTVKYCSAFILDLPEYAQILKNE